MAYFLKNNMETQEELRKKHNVQEDESVCMLCEKEYKRISEPKEIKESGEFICSSCWNEKE